jgi:hypothetical protein
MQRSILSSRGSRVSSRTRRRTGPGSRAEAFAELTTFLQTGESSYQNVAVQAGVYWSDSSQRVVLRKAILERGFLTPSCLWAFRQLRGTPDELFKEYSAPDMAFVQILLLLKK